MWAYKTPRRETHIVKSVKDTCLIEAEFSHLLHVAYIALKMLKLQFLDKRGLWITLRDAKHNTLRQNYNTLRQKHNIKPDRGLQTSEKKLIMLQIIVI